MNQNSIELTDDPDLRGSLPAIRRAALRARETARQTGTCLVFGEPDGTVTRITPEELERIEKAWIVETERRLETYRTVAATRLSVQEPGGDK
jgi:hypothetical protein